MERNRVALVVYVDLDDVPGIMHSKESAQHAVKNILRTTMGHYNPIVNLAPAHMQPISPLSRNI